MATFSLGNVPSPIAQAMRLAQLREAQNPNLAMERQIQQAAQLQQLQQQSPEGQLALQIQQAALQKNLRDLDPAYQQQQFERELEKARQLYGLRPQLSIVKDDVTGAISIVDKRKGTASGVTQAGGNTFSTGVKPTFTDLLDEKTGVKQRFALNPDGTVGSFIGTVDLPKGNIVKDEVTGAVSVVNPTLPRGTGPGQASTITTAPPIQTAPSGPQANIPNTSTGPKPFTITPKPVGVKSILATNDETGRVTNISLAPGEAVPEGFTPVTKKTSEDYKTIDAFRKEIAKNPVIKQFGDVQKSKQRIDVAMAEALETNNFVVVDQALISSFNRLLEPDSVTMVSEYARTSSDAPLINRLTAGLTRPISGGRLAQADRDALARLSNGIYQTSLGNYSRTLDYFEGIGERRGWNASDFIQPLTGQEAGAAAPSTAPAPSLQRNKGESTADYLKRKYKK